MYIMDETITPPLSSQPTTTIIHKKGSSKFLMLIIVLLLFVIVAGAAYYYGTIKPTKSETSILPSPTQSQVQEKLPTITPIQEKKLLTYSSTKMKGLSFPAYSINYPEGWVKSEEKSDIMQTLTLTKSDYSIKINQAPTGGNICVFEGTIPEGPANDYTKSKYVEINTGDIVLRRLVVEGQKNSPINHSFCSNSKTSKDSFGVPTFFGHLTYSTPANPDNAVLLEMDGIVKTLKPL